MEVNHFFSSVYDARGFLKRMAIFLSKQQIKGSLKDDIERGLRSLL